MMENEPTTATAPPWFEWLACPKCRQPLPDPARCVPCGTGFPDEDGTPRLIAPQASCEVRFHYESGRSVADEGVLARVLAEPPRHVGREALPYHLDPSQAHRLLQCPPGSRVLEIGCGPGWNRPWMKSRHFEYVGTDITKARDIELLRDHGGPDLLCDAHFLPFQDRQFDVVYAAAVFEHLACPHRAMQEVDRVLKPGGLFLANASFLEPWHGNSYFHSTPLGVVEWLSSSGFEIEHVWPGQGYHAFRSIPAMAFHGPFRLVEHLGRATYGLYLVQLLLKDLRRRARRRPPHNPAQQQAIVAGAINWIARKPVAGPHP